MSKEAEKFRWVPPPRAAASLSPAAWKVRPRHIDSRRLNIKHHDKLGIIILQDNLRCDDKVPVFVAAERKIAKYTYSVLRKGFIKFPAGQDVADAVNQYMEFVHSEFLARARRRYASLEHLEKCQVKRCGQCGEWLGGRDGFRCTACQWLVSTCGACGCGVRRRRSPEAVAGEAPDVMTIAS